MAEFSEDSYKKFLFSDPSNKNTLPIALIDNIDKFFKEDWKNIVPKGFSLTLPVVLYHVQQIVWHHIDSVNVKGSAFSLENIMSYCHYKHRNKIIFKGKCTTLEAMQNEMEMYEKREKAGVAVLTKCKKILLCVSCGFLNIPKGKRDYFDKTLVDTAIRELKEETGFDCSDTEKTALENQFKNKSLISEELNDKSVLKVFYLSGVDILDQRITNSLSHRQENERIEAVLLVPIIDCNLDYYSYFCK